MFKSHIPLKPHIWYLWGNGLVHGHFRDPEKDTNKHCLIYWAFLDNEIYFIGEQGALCYLFL